MESKIDFIKRVVKEIGFTYLSSKLGKYHSIMNVDNKIMVETLEGANNYGWKNLKSLNNNVINLIYEDLKLDFE